jgi:hypothetical protein
MRHNFLPDIHVPDPREHDHLRNTDAETKGDTLCEVESCPLSRECEAPWSGRNQGSTEVSLPFSPSAKNVLA